MSNGFKSFFHELKAIRIYNNYYLVILFPFFGPVILLKTLRVWKLLTETQRQKQIQFTVLYNTYSQK